MNQRKKQWIKECKQAERYNQLITDDDYNYYGKVSQRKLLKRTKGVDYYIHWAVRLILGISLMVYTLKQFIG